MPPFCVDTVAHTGKADQCFADFSDSLTWQIKSYWIDKIINITNLRQLSHHVTFVFQLY